MVGSRRIVGLMSGTSADGVDACVAEIEGTGPGLKWKLVAFESSPYPSDLKKAVLEASEVETARVDVICALNFVLGEFFAEAALKVVRAAGLKPAQVDLVASHGQTIHHLPNNRVIAGYSSRSTLQIGEPSVIAERLGVPVVADLRVRDIAAGGLGAPLVPHADRILFQQTGRAVAVQNLGGIGNVTLLPPSTSAKDLLAFDTGPGNMIIDAVVHDTTLGKQEYDEGGAMAAAGQADRALVERLMEDPFLAQPPPKTAGRENFGREFFRTLSTLALFGRVKGNDLVATVTAFTAASVGEAYRRFVFPYWRPDEVILCGGGSRNATLRAMIQAELGNIPVVPVDEKGIPSQAKEALSFAILGNETICGTPSSVPAATGAPRAVLLGKLIP
ncbi:MAG: anhydro-N-acetylmuramic acid kinase [Candidatus Riflebacteria bacterium]|nr:anhydro-N-acetylmuramic acid kinase [Candidatus Riflebacteria bacterium]